MERFTEVTVLKGHKCIDCRFCDAVNLVCYPESDDCNTEYHLDGFDLHTPGYCDFFKPIVGQLENIN